MENREENLYTARLAEQAERYEEMVECMKNISHLGTGLTQDERNLLSVAYKNVIGSRRASWRVISSLELKAKENEEDAPLVTEYRKLIEKELQNICTDILDLLETHLIPAAKPKDDDEDNSESLVFYYKMKGDYLRYLAEFTKGNENRDAAENSLVAYKSATDAAADSLDSTHPIRLGLALNFSVFYYEILNSPERACKLARQAFDDAAVNLDKLSGENYKDSTLIMQLLRDNLTLWTADMNDEENKEQVQDINDGDEM